MIPVTVAVVGAIAGVLGLAVAMVAHSRAARVMDECARLIRSQLRDAVTTTTTTDDRALRDLSIVHYDALKEMSGQLSFSMAILNAAGDGVVLTSINGRTETRTYAKVVEGGRGLQALSPEEERALRAARLGQGPRVPNTDGQQPKQLSAAPLPPAG